MSLWACDGSTCGLWYVPPQVLLPWTPFWIRQGVSTVLLYSARDAYFRWLQAFKCNRAFEERHPESISSLWLRKESQSSVFVRVCVYAWLLLTVPRISCFAAGWLVQLKAGVWLCLAGNCSAPAEVLGERRPPASVSWQELNHLEELWTWPAAETELIN